MAGTFENNHGHKTINVRQWLDDRVGAYTILQPDEVRAIEDFVLVWTVFENVVCDTEASVPKFKAIAESFAEEDMCRLPLLSAVEYFSKRYFPGNMESHHFRFLNWRGKGGDVPAKALVTDVLTGQEANPNKMLEGLLCIIYRIRNNLLHGTKWAYGIQGQKQNFTHSMAVLMCVVDAVERNQKKRR